jgi:muconolactone D-isomerase
VYPGRFANIGMWRARDATEVHELLGDLTFFPWMDIVVEPLARHPLTAMCEADR